MSTGMTTKAVLFCGLAVATLYAPAAVSQDTGGQPVVVEAPDVANQSGVSDAQEFFRRGVGLYKRELYREALSQFNRALTLDPSLDDARVFIEKCNAKLQLSLGGTATDSAASFETFDPDSISDGETPPASAEELKRERIRVLLNQAQRYMEATYYDEAKDIYQQVLLVDPDNRHGVDGLHEATLKANDRAVVEAERVVQEDRSRIRRIISDKKSLPEGANADGIKPIRFQTPDIIEDIVIEEQETEVDRLLQSPVSIEFEDIHINDIIAFISDSWNINIVIDSRAVEPPRPVANDAGAGGPVVAGGPGRFPGPGNQGGFGANQGGNNNGRLNLSNFQQNQPGNARFNQPGGINANNNFNQGGNFAGTRTDGMVPYIALKDVTLEQGLDALLRPLGLDYQVLPAYIWVSRPDLIRSESFEDIETRFYELRNAGAETLFKIVLRAIPVSQNNGNQGGFGGGNSGGFGGNSGGFGGNSGGFGGGSTGGFGGGNTGGFGGGNSGGFGQSSGGFGGSSGGFGGGSTGGFGGGNTGGFGGGNSGGFGGGNQGGFGGGGGGRNGGDVSSISNISQLMSSINDAQVGEIPATNFIVGLNNQGTGAGNRNGNIGGGGFNAANNGAGLGNTQNVGDSAPILDLLQRMIPEVYEPYTGTLLSDMIYNPINNQLIVKNTPSNLSSFEKRLAEIDVTPRQVSIEAKFLTVRVGDLDKVGFKWNFSGSDLNDRTRSILALEDDTYDFDINGDGVLEEVPFFTRPDGSSVIDNTVTEGMVDILTSPGSLTNTASLGFNILQNADGDSLSLTLDLLDSLSETELLSAPRVTTMNRKPAVIVDYTTEYFVTQVQSGVFVTDGGFGGTPTTNIVNQAIPQAFNFGISLSVTPQIRDDDNVRLWLNPEVRTRLGEKQFEQTNISEGNEQTSVFTLPTVSWQAVWTNVIVHDGDTLVLGGLVQDQTIKGEDKVPYIGNIPLVGFFFRGKSREVSQSSLLIFVTPNILDTTGARYFDVGSN